MIQYMQGETAVLAFESRLWTTNALTTPTTSYTVDLWDSEDTQKLTTQAMTEDSTGKISHNYAVGATGALGTWYGTFNLTSGSVVTMEPFEFEVVKRRSP